MTQPTPAAAPALSWPEPPDKCPACGAPIVERIQFLIVYECEQAILTQHRDGKSIEHPDSHCTRAFPAAVAQRQRAEDAERDYAALLEDYNAAAAWLGVLESGDDLEVAAKSLTDQLSDVLQRADALQAERAAAYVRADTEYAARVRLTEKYDKLDEERDALTAQVATLRAALDSIIEYAGPADDTGNSFWQCRACGWPLGQIRSRRDAVKHAPDCAYIAAKSALAAAPAPDPNAPSLDDFTHWPFPPETLPAPPKQDADA